MNEENKNDKPHPLASEASITLKITKEDVDSFAQLSGDKNPLHVDEKFARSTRFKKRVVHGAFLASLFSQLVGMHLGTPNVLYISQTSNFKQPVFIGDTVTARFKLKSYSESTKIATYAAEIAKNNEDKPCVEGETKVALL